MLIKDQKIIILIIKEKYKQYNKQYRIKNKDYLKKYQKIWELNNKEKRKLYHKQYNTKNRNRRSEYARKRAKIDFKFKTKRYLRTRVCQAINSLDKSLSIMFLIGCEIDYLMFHLQSKFKAGMSLDNYGEWHIDHIKPCASYDLSKPEEQRKCFHYSNLQPLWAKENLSKSDN